MNEPTWAQAAAQPAQAQAASTRLDGDAAARARAERAITIIDQNTRAILSRALPIAFIAAAVVTVLWVLAVGPIAGIVVTALLPVFVAVMVRMGLVGVAVRATQSRMRRVLLRWMPRLFLLTSFWGWSQAMIPWLNLVVLPITTFALVTAVHMWCLRQMRREALGAPVSTGEIWVLVTATALLLFSFGLVVFVAIVFGKALHMVFSAVLMRG